MNILEDFQKKAKNVEEALTKNAGIIILLIDDFKKRYPDHHTGILDDIIEECGIWYPSLTAVRAEWEDWEATLEEVCGAMYFVINQNIIWFTSPDSLWEDIDEYMSSHY